jgi:hypothetical protein
MAVEINSTHERAVVIGLAVLCLITWSAIAINQKDKTAELGRGLTSKVLHVRIGNGQVRFEANQPVTDTASSIKNTGQTAGESFSRN